MKIALLTLGCKVNQAEMSDVESALRGGGHRLVALKDSPDLSIVNTCAVTSKSEYQSRQLIRRAARTGGRVIATGCYCQLSPEAAKGLGGNVEVVDNANKSHIITLICGDHKCNTLNIKGSRTRLSVKVQDGCNRACSYCIVPKARGGPRSVPVDRVVEKVRAAAALGYKEVVLTGVHLGLYGVDSGSDLPTLLENVLKNTEIHRIRLSSIEVSEIDGRLLGLLGDRRVCRHLHVPLQSGSDKVLALMGRPYNTAYFKDKLLTIADRLGDASFGTDVIVGFPYEEADDFDETLRFLVGLPFTYLHVFPFSRRPGTAAGVMPDTVSPTEKKRRASVLRGLSARLRRDYIKRLIGSTVEVLLEVGASGSGWEGTSGNYLKVRLQGAGLDTGRLVVAEITGQNGEAATASLVHAGVEGRNDDTTS